MAFRIVLLWTLLIASLWSYASGLVKTEEELIKALDTGNRVVLGSSIVINKELPKITKFVKLVGHARACKQRSCYIDAQMKTRHVTVVGDGSLSLYNLELRNGNSTDDDGGSILVRDGGSLQVYGSRFSNSKVALFSVGGAVCVRNGSTASIGRSWFVKNTAGFGGAVGVSENSKADIRNSFFQHNYATLSGGGLEFLAKSSALLVDNTYENNTASIGGASTAHDSLLSICGASFTQNKGSLDGPNIMSEGGSNITICRANSSDVSGAVAIEDCAPCKAPGRVPGVRGDPHIRGPHGETFDFHGVPEQTYCLISDGDLQLNMKIMAANGNSSTYIKELGLVYLNQTVWLSSSSTLLVNKQEMPMNSTTWSFPDQLMVTRTRNEVIVEVPRHFSLSLRIGKRKSVTNFLNLGVAYFIPSGSANGIFGQLYPTAHENAMQFEGSGKFKSLVDSESYRVADILSSHYKKL